MVSLWRSLGAVLGSMTPLLWGYARAMLSGSERPGQGDALTRAQGGARTVPCRPWSGAEQAAEPANRRVGILPMRNGSRQGEAPQDEDANSCIYNIRHTAPFDESPWFAVTFCGILSQRNFTRHKMKEFKRFYTYTPPPASPLSPML